MNFIRMLFFVTVLLTASIALTPNAFSESLEISQREASNLGITTIKPLRTDQLTTISAMANVVIPPQSDMAVAVFQEGVIASLYVGTGDRVTRGQPLAAVISPDFLTLQSNYLDALGTHTLAASSLNRDEQLHSEGIVSQRRLQETQNQAAEAELHLAEQRHLLVLSGVTDADIHQLARNRLFIDTLTVRSPGDGDVLHRWIRAGDQVSPGQPLFRIADVENLWLEIQLPAEKLPMMQPGLRVTRNLPGAKELLALTSVTTRAVDPSTQKTIVRAESVGAEHNLLPGQRLEVMIHIPASPPAQSTRWEIPARVITHHADQAYLFVQHDAGFEPLPITILGRQGELAYIDADINSQTQIALTGIAALKAIWLTTEDKQ